MKVGLFVPCYINHFYPEVGIATLKLLQRHKVEVDYPAGQTCCGQPLANSGFTHLTEDCSDLFIRQFQSYDFIVVPSGSCALHLKEHLFSKKNMPLALNLREKVIELTSFMFNALQIKNLKAQFPFTVGVHQSCHGQRGLMLSSMSELMGTRYSIPETLLNMVSGIKLIKLQRPDECCGFGGTFCINEEAISVKMGKDRVNDHTLNGAQYITSVDMSCLMHMDGILKRSKSQVKVIHIAQILLGLEN